MAVKGHNVLTANINLKDTMQTPATNTSQPLSPGKGLTQAEKDDINLFFSDVINTNAPLRLAETHNVMSVSNEEVVGRIYRCVKYHQAKNMTANLKRMASEEPANRTSSWVKSYEKVKNMFKKRSK